MKFINNLNIRAKLISLFLSLGAFIIIFIYTTSGIYKNSQEHREVHFNIFEITSINTNIIFPLYKLRENTESLIYSQNKKISNLSSKITDLSQKIDNGFKKHNNLKYIENWIDLKKEIQIILKNIKEKNIKESRELFEKKSMNTFNYLTSSLIVDNEEFLKETNALYYQAWDESNIILIKSYIIMFFVLIITIAGGWFISNSIIISIKKVQSGLIDFFDFLNYKETEIKKINLSSTDEFAQMAKVININVDNIQSNIKEDRVLIKNATNLLKEIKQGDIGARISASTNNETLNELKVMMNSMLENLENQIQVEIKKRIEQEELLIQQSKLASMGEMIGNIAHQWRQPISQISAILLNIQARQEFDQCSKEYFDKKVEDANKLTNYMSKTISDFQNFFKPDSIKTLFSIKEACKEALFIVEASLKYHGVNIHFEENEDSQIQGYKNEYSQAILNILNNARDVLLERKVNNPKIKITIKNGKTYGLVKIEDNAGGVSEDIRKKIFEPYFTTKHKSKGTGIGLYMSKTIIENNMNGFINIKNTDNGACFTIKVMK